MTLVASSVSPSALSLITPSETGAAASAVELAEASQQFEAVFLRQFLGEALQPLLSMTPEGGGSNSHVYQYLVTQVLSESLAQQEVFGLSSLLQQQLSGSVGLEAPRSKDEVQ